jgi:hypothetical protein
MKKLKLSEISAKIRIAVMRFSLTVFCVLGLAVLFLININDKNSDIPERLWVLFGLGIPFTLMVALLAENFKNNIVGIGLQIIGIVALILHVFFLPEKLQIVDIYQSVVFGLSCALSVFFVSFLKKYDAVPFWEFSKTVIIQLITAFIFAGVLMLGFSLAALSIDQLFKVDVHDEVYENLSVICFALYAPFYFLTNIPYDSDKYLQEYKFDKFLKILGLYILLPILAVYAIILYVYAFKIIVEWQLPNGWVTWLVSVLALAGFVTMMILYPLRLQRNKVGLYFSHFFPAILLPLVILMTIGISRRFDDYGLTVNRAYVFLFNLWLYGICVYLLISHAKYLKWIFVSFVTVAVISSVGPWSVYHITQRNMQDNTEKLLNDIHYQKDGKILPLEQLKQINVDKVALDKLSAKFDYLINYYGSGIVQKYFDDDLSKLNRYEILERLNMKTNYGSYTGNRYYNAHLMSENVILDISNYKTMFKINLQHGEINLNNSVYAAKMENSTLMIFNKITGKTIVQVSLSDKLNEFSKYENYKEYTLKDMTVSGMNYQLIIETINAQRNSEKNMVINDFEAILMIR